MPEVSGAYDDVPDVGLLYDAIPLYAARPDVPFYVAEAEGARGRGGGAVLELGCGTGRVTLPLARAGHTVVGVDGSAGMLARCRDTLAAEPDVVRARVTLHQADVRALELGRTFALAIAPFRVVQHLVTIDDQLRALRAIARHLAPGGRLVFDVFNPSFRALVAADGVEREDTPETPLPDGRTVRRLVRVRRVRFVDQVSEIELLYDVAPSPGAPPVRHVHAFEMRWYLRAELEHLLARAGLAVESVYGDMERNPLTDASPDIVVSARREG